jgi:hypothetical protein
MVAAVLLATLFSIPGVVSDAAAGYSVVAWLNLAQMVATVAVLIALRLRPLWFPVLINTLFAAVTASQLLETAWFGGFVESGLVVMFSLVIVTGALITFGFRAALLVVWRLRRFGDLCPPDSPVGRAPV